MHIRKAELEDLNIIIEIYKNAIKYLNENKIYQWDEIYPNKAILEEDILKKEMYIGIVNNAIVSVVVINSEYDEHYDNFNWECDNFAVIHRLCVNPVNQNQKIGKNTMILIEELLKEKGIKSIRLDAFSLNPYSLRMYDNLGYKKVGETNWRKGLFYLFEKRI
ncbi:MAG: sortase-like acyltransferase [Bacillota bacterium]|jgi:ribosomal protein S18 acetylase RimI-like enzyme|nr:sortase-like acyltransferase [Bacillota bacterium]